MGQDDLTSYGCPHGSGGFQTENISQDTDHKCDATEIQVQIETLQLSIEKCRSNPLLNHLRIMH